MIPCKEFIESIKDFIAEELSEPDSEKMIEHLKECEACRREYEQQLKAYEFLGKMSSEEDMTFISSRSEIFSSIDKTKYGNGFINKLSVFFKRNTGKYATALLTIVLMLSIGAYSIRFLKDYSFSGKPFIFTGKVNPQQAENSQGLSNSEVEKNKETISNFIREYYSVTKEDRLLAKDVRDGFIDNNDKEVNDLMAKVDEHYSLLKPYITTSLYDDLYTIRAWTARGITQEKIDFTVEVKDVNVVENGKTDDGKLLKYKSAFILEKKDFNGIVLAVQTINKDFYLAKEDGKWKITTGTRIEIIDSKFKFY